MTSISITAHRLRNQRIAAPTPPSAASQAQPASPHVAPATKPAALAAWLGIAQAQDYASGLLSLGLRLPGATVATIERALADRTLIRTWALRGTLHLIAAADVRWIVGLAAPNAIAAAAPMVRQRGLDDATFARSAAAIAEAMAGGVRLARQELYDVLEAAGIATAGGRGMHLINRAALDRLICMGPPRGKQQTFVLLDEWAEPAEDLSRPAALAELARRYFLSHGPATLKDFAWWGGISITEARAGIAAQGDRLAEVAIDGKTYWMAPDAAGSPLGAAEPSPTAHLIPGFDEYILGYADRSAAIDPGDWRRISPVNGIFAPNIVIDGRVAGTWKRTVKRDSVEIALNPFVPLGDAQRAAVAEAAERYGRFVGLRPLVAVAEASRAAPASDGDV